MKINTRNKTITSIDISNNETAWAIEDAVEVLAYLTHKKAIVLGGDILTPTLEYNYDSWYYNVEANKDFQFNVDSSIKLAIQYISNYIKKNGSAFYVVFIVELGYA